MKRLIRHEALRYEATLSSRLLLRERWVCGSYDWEARVVTWLPIDPRRSLHLSSELSARCLMSSFSRFLSSPATKELGESNDGRYVTERAAA